MLAGKAPRIGSTAKPQPLSAATPSRFFTQHFLPTQRIKTLAMEKRGRPLVGGFVTLESPFGGDIPGSASWLANGGATKALGSLGQAAGCFF